MLTIILILGIIAAILTILIVLIQNPKGGGLASNFSAGNQLFGAKQTTEGVEKLTWIFVAIILVVSLAASSYNGKKASKAGTETSTSADESVNDAINAKAPKTVAPAAPQNQGFAPGDPNAQPATPQTTPPPPADPTK